MKTYQELKQEAELLLKQADEARKREAQQVIESVFATLEANGLTVDDLLAKGKKKFGLVNRIKRIVPVKYKGPNGETWTGRGQKPVWLATLISQGRNKEEFLIK